MTIRAQNYKYQHAYVMKIMEKLSSCKKVLAHYTCSSAPRKYEFASFSIRKPFKNLPEVFKRWSILKRSIKGYHIYFIQEHSEELAMKFNVIPCQFLPLEEKCSTDLASAKKLTELNLVSDTTSETESE